MSHTDNEITAHLAEMKAQMRIYDEARAAQGKDLRDPEERRLLHQVIVEADRKFEAAYQWLQIHCVARLVWNDVAQCYEIEEVEDRHAKQRENHWIRVYLDQGASLVNADLPKQRVDITLSPELLRFLDEDEESESRSGRIERIIRATPEFILWWQHSQDRNT